MDHLVRDGDPSADPGNPREPHVRICLFGSVRLDVAGRGPQHVPGKIGELIGYLALAGGGERWVARERAAFALWPDQSERAARRSLASTVYRLRRTFPGAEAWFIAGRDALQVRGAWLDVEAFSAGADSADPADWRSAIDLYVGDLLPSVDAEWADRSRTVLRDRYIGLLGALTAQHEAADDLALALASARQWASADPLDESAHRAVMRLYGRLGRHSAALDHHDGLVARLDADLGVAPDPETSDLADRIRLDLELIRGSTARTSDAPFVGRAAELRTLLTGLDRARAGQGTVMVVMGEAGIGKSRLLKELERAAEWRGWQVSYGRGEQFGSPAPFAPLSEALRRALPPPRRDQLERLLDPAWRAGVTPLVPELSVAGSEIRAPTSIEDLAHAVSEVLGGLGKLAPHLLLLDDVQWADQATWELLERLRPALAGMPVAIAVSGRSDELSEQAGTWARLEAWDREGAPAVHLDAMGLAELTALSARFGKRSSPELRALALASGGNPLLALALLQADEVVTAGMTIGDRRGLGPSLDRLFEHRLAARSADALAAIEAAAVIGQRFSYTVWEEVAARDLVAAAAELERAQLLRLDDDGYGFAHDTLRSLVLWRMDPDRRRGLHAAAYDVLMRHSPNEVTALLFHAEQIEDWPAVAVWAHRAGEEALERLSFQAAARHFTRALEVLPAEEREARFAALAGRVRALDVLADRDGQRADLSELEDLAEALGDTRRRVTAATQRARFHWAVGEFAEGEAVAAAAVEDAAAEGVIASQAELLTILGRVLREQGNLERATAVLTRSGALYRQLGDVVGSATALELLGGIAWRTGDHLTAATEHAEAATLFERTGDMRHAAMSLNSLGTALWSLGRYDDAREVHERSLVTARALGDRRLEADNLDNLGGVAWVLADFERAVELYRQALAIRRDSADPRGVAISLLNLGDTYALTGDVRRALDHYDEALAVDRGVGVRRNTATARQGKGKALLEAGRAREALEELDAAAEMHLDLGDRDNLADTHAARALACLELGDPVSARRAAAAALELLQAADRPALRQVVHLAAFGAAAAAGDARGAATHLAHAVGAMDEFVASLPTGARQRTLERVPLNRRTVTAREAAAVRTVVTLPRSDAPLGRAVMPGETIQVTLTTTDPADALVASGARRRRAVVARLVAEAVAQGASVTDDDLAAAIGVSRRTILRDMAEMERQGMLLPTRRRSRSS